MPIKPELVEYVRTFLKGDREANDRIEARLDEEGWDGFARLLAMLFFLAVERKFGDTVEPPEIIRFVAELRAYVSDGGPEVDASAAEALIKSAIDPTFEHDVDPEAAGTIQALTVHQVFNEAELSPEELEAVVSEAVALASSEV